MSEFIEKLLEKVFLDDGKFDRLLEKIAEKTAEKFAIYLIEQDKKENNKKDNEPDKKPEWKYYPKNDIALMYGCVPNPYNDDDFKITTITTKKVDEILTFDACNLTGGDIVDKVTESNAANKKGDEPVNTEFEDNFDYQKFEEKDIEDKLENQTLCDDFNKYAMRLTPLEYARYKKFANNHVHKDKYAGAIGGTLSLNLVMTSIGVGKSCECSFCKKTANITEYNW